MPNLGLPELIIILVVALLVFGPKRLPEVGRSVGRGLREFRRASTELRDELERSVDDTHEPASTVRDAEVPAAADPHLDPPPRDPAPG